MASDRNDTCRDHAQYDRESTGGDAHETLDGSVGAWIRPRRVSSLLIVMRCEFLELGRRYNSLFLQLVSVRRLFSANIEGLANELADSSQVAFSGLVPEKIEQRLA